MSYAVKIGVTGGCVVRELSDACLDLMNVPFHEQAMSLGARSLLVELEDFDFDELSDGQILESAGLHALYEGGVDLEDAHLD